ncbi:unnamed protein product [Urochloa decumbens]|uniref:F-box domain-containing protein n=1 Tax=Urochloa decumbens TaxID=240449 RepID=A0ABC8VYZ6_9POAL
MASSSTAPLPPVATGWAALPRDVLWSLFTELGHREVLSGAGLACVAWRRLARQEPALWRRIDLTTAAGDTVSGWKEMALAAIDRSAGQCEAFWGRADNEVLLYLANRAPSMKSLRLTSHYDVSSEVFTELIKKFPLLEELELVLKYDTNNYSTKSAQRRTNSWLELFQSACKACSHLHHFTVCSAGKEQHSGRYYPRGRPRTPKPFSIPMMHGLNSFELSGDSSLTNDVVMQIVDNCPNLKSLNISDVRYEDKWELKLLNNKCYRIKDLKLPAVFYEPDTDYSSDEDMS